MISRGDPPAVLDLLHPIALERIDTEATRVAVTLAFAGGTSGGLFSEALEKARVAPSSWDPRGFAEDLFLSRFVSQCFRIQIGAVALPPNENHLLRILAQPPAEAAVVAHRREILAELVNEPGLRSEFERLYLDLCRLRSLLENAGSMQIWDANRRKLDILALLRRVLDRLASGFSGARSGLGRLAEFGEARRANEAYAALRDLLSYDAELATVNLKVGVGADGKIRGFSVVAIDERSDNPFVSPAWRRWLAKFELFLRGYHFGDGEVMSRLVDAVFTGLEHDFVALVQLFGDLEFYLGALGFRDRAAQAGLEVCLPDFVGAAEARVVRRLFNPLLLMNGVTPVPCDLLGLPLTSTVLVTGPNSGGKTRLLQSLGLCQLLAQSGTFVPAASARLTLASGLLASLIEDTRVDQSEGRLGTELLRIRALFERLPPGAMVLLDELCSGTNPSEGEQIFELVVGMLERLAPQAFISTHFLTFAARLERENKIQSLGFLQVELDGHRRPTYQFVRGVAQTSLAGHTAERLGVTGEQLLGLIERNLRQRPPLASSGAGGGAWPPSS